MSARDFRDRLIRRVQRAGAVVPDEVALGKLEAYFTLLSRWNSKINLTALPLDRPTDETFDRLFVEPLVAARHFPSGVTAWFDLGTGGGSPALPLKILQPAGCLTMVESKLRKAAFLREAVRTLELHDAVVENARFEDLAGRSAGTAQVVTVRAVRPDSALFQVAASLLAPGGCLLLFRQDSRVRQVQPFEHLNVVELVSGRPSYLAIYGRA